MKLEVMKLEIMKLEVMKLEVMKFETVPIKQLLQISFKNQAKMSPKLVSFKYLIFIGDSCIQYKNIFIFETHLRRKIENYLPLKVSPFSFFKYLLTPTYKQQNMAVWASTLGRSTTILKIMQIRRESPSNTPFL